MTFGLKGVTVRFHDRIALDHVDCRIEAGRVEAVIGPDGAGKTTLARVLVGLVRADTGQVLRPGRRLLGYQPESAGTWRDLTVAENFAFVARTRGRGDDLDARIDDLVESTGLGAATDRLAGDLSGGMRQKLAVAMAILPRPDLVVLDEPTTGLDPVSRADVWRLLSRAAGEGAAIVVTTAYLDEAERADHVVVLDGGRVLVHGTAEAIRASFPGRLVAGDHADEIHSSWRRGRAWRTWIRPTAAPDGDAGPDGRDLEPDLEDVVMAAAIRRREQAA